MPRSTDIRMVGTEVYFLPVTTRVPLKFGAETVTSVTCARVRVRVADRAGHLAEGWGETPLSVQWVWPSALSLTSRQDRLLRLCVALAKEWAQFDAWGHSIEVGHSFLEDVLPRVLADANAAVGTAKEPIPWLAALVCCSPFDLALHDAFANRVGLPVYDTYHSRFMSRDLASFLETAGDRGVTFDRLTVSDFLVHVPPQSLEAWHLVGGLDPLDSGELQGNEPRDGYPVLLADWIREDGLKCLKVKLRGTDADWDYARLVKVGEIGGPLGVEALSADFNCTVRDPAYVCDILDRLHRDRPRVFEMLLYVEQPFPYDLEAHRIDVRSISRRKPLFLDESAHGWRQVRLGRDLGWTGVALKTCKTQTGALLSACWAKAHGVPLMVQDLTNPMLAQVSHVQLAAHVGTIRGVETNAMQFYPEASAPERSVHPGLYARRRGRIDLATVSGPGFGYRLTEIPRVLPAPAAAYQR